MSKFQYYFTDLEYPKRLNILAFIGKYPIRKAIVVITLLYYSFV